MRPVIPIASSKEMKIPVAVIASIEGCKEECTVGSKVDALSKADIIQRFSADRVYRGLHSANVSPANQ